MEVRTTALPGVLIVVPTVFGDARGFLLELHHQRRYADCGIAETFVQDNVSRSQRGALRGLHYQFPSPQGKLVSVLQGEVFDVAADIRPGSPHFGRWVAVTLSAANHHQLYLPPGYAHGFAALADDTITTYKCTDFYDPATEAVVAWNDPDLGVRWPIDEPLLSARDAAAPPLAQIPTERLPPYEALTADRPGDAG